MRRTRLATVVAVACCVVASCSKVDTSDLPTSVPGVGPTTTIALDESAAPCAGSDGVGAEVPDGARAGDLVEATELADRPSASDPKTTNADTEGFPDGAQVWRILYVSTGADETDLRLVCGLVAAPADGPALDSERGTATMVAWSHGTVGVEQACMPSNEPETGFWGAMGGGIGAIAWGSGLGAKKGDPSNGALQTMLDRGWVVAATDYIPDDSYIIGRIAAANTIDAARAASELMTNEHGGAGPDAYDTLAWGHSQGGHASLWTGQLFEEYLEVAPNGNSELLLAGVAAEAPASNLIVQPALQDGVEYGDGLADWEMHKSIEVFNVPIPALELQIGPSLFSYIFGSWTEFSAREAPADGARLPAYPPDAPELDLAAVATPQGAETIAQIQALCLSGDDSKAVKQLTDPYRNAGKAKMLTEELWNLPEDYSDGEFFHGGVDRTCDTTEDQGLTRWCDWIRWNIPGPLGANPFPKLPTSGGQPVPLLIAQGAHDQVIHCIADSDSDSDTATGAVAVPAASDCMSVALYESLSTGGYCSGGTNAAGHLQLSMFAADGSSSPGSHLAIPGQIAARSVDALEFDGSPLDRFMSGALEGSLDAGCSAEVLNAR